MQTIRRGIEIIRDEGLIPFFRASFRFIYWNLGLRTLCLTFRHKINGANVNVTVGDASVDLSANTYPEFERFYNLKGERKVLSDVLKEVSNNDVFYDVGANVGLYSCLVGSAAPKCSIYSFEPHPTNVEALKQNLQLNSVASTIFQMALSDEDGRFELSSEGTESGLGEHSLDASESESTVPVTVRRLDTLRDEHDIPVPSVVKIDVEGAEQDVINGGIETFSDPDCRTIYCEVHPDRISKFGGSYDELKDLLADLGFDLEVIDRDVGERIMLKATK